jgi:hypothetical protein
MALASLLRALAPLLLLALAGGAPPQSARECATTCVARDCEKFSINYGKYCGITHTGCPGEEPCDAYDSCCQAHDACVTSGGVSKQDQRCHELFVRCLKKAEGSPSFTNDESCAGAVVAKTMADGISLASKFASLLQQPRRKEL